MVRNIEFWKLLVSILGFGGTITTLYFALRQYRRSEQWKRGEFVAKEIKEFEADPTVQVAFQLIDWGRRRINIFQKQNPIDTDYIEITRDDQWKALLPHVLKPFYPGGFPSSSSDKPKFSPEEAKIRDTYDAFFRYLERFANFVKSDLVTADEFKPYLSYWLNAIAKSSNDEDNKKDARWRCALFTYIIFYHYTGTQKLLEDYGIDIKQSESLYKRQGELMTEKPVEKVKKEPDFTKERDLFKDLSDTLVSRSQPAA